MSKFIDKLKKKIFDAEKMNGSSSKDKLAHNNGIDKSYKDKLIKKYRGK